MIVTKPLLFLSINLWLVYLLANRFAEINADEEYKNEGIWIRILPMHDSVQVMCSSTDGGQLGRAALRFNDQSIDDVKSIDNGKSIFKEFEFNEFQPGNYVCQFENGDAAFRYKDGPSLAELLINEVYEISVEINGKDRLASIQMQTTSTKTEFQCHVDNADMNLKSSNENPWGINKGFDGYLEDDNIKRRYSCTIDKLKQFQFHLGYTDSIPRLTEFHVNLFIDHNNRLNVRTTCSSFEIYKEESGIMTTPKLLYNEKPVPQGTGLKRLAQDSTITENLKYECIIENPLGADVVAIEFIRPTEWNLKKNESISIRANLIKKSMKILYHSPNSSDEMQYACIRNGHTLSVDPTNGKGFRGDVWLENDVSCRLMSVKRMEFSLIRKGLRPVITSFAVNYKPNGLATVHCGGNKRLIEHRLKIDYLKPPFTINESLANYTVKSDDNLEKAKDEYRVRDYPPNSHYLNYQSSDKTSLDGIFTCTISSKTGSDTVSLRLINNATEKPYALVTSNDGSTVRLDPSITLVKEMAWYQWSPDECLMKNHLPDNGRIISIGYPGGGGGSYDQCGGRCYTCYSKEHSTYLVEFTRKDRIKKT